MSCYTCANSTPLAGCILETPKTKLPPAAKPQDMVTDPSTKYRSSQRLKQKSNKGKSILKMAQDLVARKCGIVQEGQDLDDVTLQQYVDMYKQPLSDQSMEVIFQLTEVAKDKKMKKKGKSKKKKIEDPKKMKEPKNKVKTKIAEGQPSAQATRSKA
jgi:hypothetical protein